MQIIAAMRDDRRNHGCKEIAIEELPLQAGDRRYAAGTISGTWVGMAESSTVARHAVRIGAVEAPPAALTVRSFNAAERYAKRAGIFR